MCQDCRLILNRKIAAKTARLASIQAKARQHASSQQVLKAQRTRHLKAQRDRQRANPNNFTASNHDIANQIAWMDSNNLLPDPRRKDFDLKASRAGSKARRPL
jgi:hypothetical protein